MASTFFKDIEWIVSPTLIDYPEAIAFMEHRVEKIHQEKAAPCLWFLEHPPLYTLGTSGSLKDVLDSNLPLFSTGRGGKVTYHGPGQRVIYVMMDLKDRASDLRAYIRSLESWIILTLKVLGFDSFTDPKRVGVWVKTKEGREEKIASIGVRVRKWVTFHGLALNVDPDLTHFNNIIPCGLQNYGVTSLKSLGYERTLKSVDDAFQQTFAQAF